MRTSRLHTAVFVMAVCFLSSCKKELSDTSLRCKLSSGMLGYSSGFLGGGVYGQGIEYDEERKVVAYYTFDDRRVTFEYEPTLVRRVSDGVLLDHYVLNKRGLAIQNTKSLKTYEYDANGFLIKESGMISGGAGTTIHIVENGNRVLSISSDNSNTYHDTMRYFYYPAIDPMHGETPLRFLGKKWSQLLKRTELTRSYNSQKSYRDFTYVTNERGYITETLEVMSGDGPNGKVQTWQYWDCGL